MKEFFVSKIKKYLPSFIVNSVILTAIISTVSNAMDVLYTEITALKNSRYTGKGLKLSLAEFHIFYKPTDSEATLQDYYDRRFEILRDRGTEAGITAELAMISEAGYSAELYGLDESGIIVEKIFPGIDPQCAVDLGKCLYITSITNDLKKNESIIRAELLPIDVKLILE